MTRFLAFSLLFLLYFPSYAQGGPYFYRLMGAPLALANMDAQSSGWGGIQIVAPDSRASFSFEGNPAFFRPNQTQLGFHISNWRIPSSVNEEPLLILQHTGNQSLGANHQISWGVKHLVPDTLTWLGVSE